MIYEEEDIAIFAVGNMVETAEAVCRKLKEKGYHASLINARFVKPLDQNVLCRMAKKSRLFVTMEEGILSGGYGENVVAFLNENELQVRVLTEGIKDRFVEHGSVDVLRREVGLFADDIFDRIIAALTEEGRH